MGQAIRRIAAIFIAMFLVAPAVQAAPISIQAGQTVNNTTDSRVLADNEDPNQLWVLPPTTGTVGRIDLDSLAVTSEQCQAAKLSDDGLLQTQKLRALLSSQLEALILQTTDPNITPEQMNAATAKLASVQALIATQEKAERDASLAANAIPGGVLNILYTNKWMDNVLAIRAANPGYTVQKIGTSNLDLSFAIPDSIQDGRPSDSGVVVRYYTAQGGVQGGEFTERLQIDLYITRLGACYFKFPSMFGLIAPPRLALAAQYKHPITYTTKWEAEYNLLSVYEFVRKTGTKGGLFSSSSFSSTVESGWGTTAINFKWTETDPDNRIPVDQRRQLENDIKREMIVAMDKLALEQLEAAGPGNSPPPGASGAAVISEGLMKACPGNPYCVGGSLAMQAMNSIFGSSSQSVSYRRTIDRTVKMKSDSSSATRASSSTLYTL